jgi:hypothetical protein
VRAGAGRRPASICAVLLADKTVMSQHPGVTIGWAVAGLETAITRLSDGPAERRVRAQFHQLLLALERARLPIELRTAANTGKPLAGRELIVAGLRSRR